MTDEQMPRVPLQEIKRLASRVLEVLEIVELARTDLTQLHRRDEPAQRAIRAVLLANAQQQLMQASDLLVGLQREFIDDPEPARPARGGVALL